MRIVLTAWTLTIVVIVVNYFIRLPPPTSDPSIMFVKTHKTGSSTLHNILCRYNKDRNIVKAPLHGIGYYKFNGELLSLSRIRAKNSILGATFNLFPHHCVYDFGDDYMEKSIFGKIPFRLTIMREPSRTISSVIKYFTLFGGGNDLNKVKAKLFDGHGKVDSMTEKARNGMADGLGFNARQWNSVDDFIAALDNRVDLVMITEMFDESLLVMKQMFEQRGWVISYTDLSYVVSNSNKDTRTTPIDVKGWADVDIALYGHFKRKLESYIENEYGSLRMEYDLAKFRKYLHDTSTRCYDGTITDRETLEKKHDVYFPHSKFTSSIPHVSHGQENDALCVEMAMSQVALEKLLNI